MARTAVLECSARSGAVVGKERLGKRGMIPGLRGWHRDGFDGGPGMTADPSVYWEGYGCIDDRPW